MPQGLKAGDPLQVIKCDPKDAGHTWKHRDDDRFETLDPGGGGTGLCIDPMRFDHATYPEVGRGWENSVWPATLQPCGKSEIQRLKAVYVDIEESARAAEARLHAQGAAGH